MDAVYDPFEHAEILAEAGPEKFSVSIFTEPVYVEDARSHAERALHFDPVAEVIAHVISAEGKHGHGVAADRKSTRLNSSHQIISYAVFCLKKKKEDLQYPR